MLLIGRPHDEAHQLASKPRPMKRPSTNRLMLIWATGEQQEHLDHGRSPTKDEEPGDDHERARAVTAGRVHHEKRSAKACRLRARHSRILGRQHLLLAERATQSVANTTQIGRPAAQNPFDLVTD